MTMYLFYELLTLATLPLVMQPMSTTARKAGVKYAVYSMSGAALAFIGLVFLIVNGAQDFTLGGHLAGYTGDRQLLLTVFVLAFVGFGVKAAIWPLHAWLPAAAVDTYQPLPIIGFGVLLVSALLTAIYMFQIAVRAWFPRHSAPAIPEGSVHEAGWQMLVPMVVLAAACLLMGLMPQGLLDLIREAVTL